MYGSKWIDTNTTLAISVKRSYVKKNKNKSVILLGDFNVEILKYKTDSNTADFHGQVYLYPLYHK